MGFYQSCVLPHLVNLALNTDAVKAQRAQCLEGVRGRVLEVGFGSGLNLPFYPPAVTQLVGVDPSGASAKLARARIAATPFPVEMIGLSAETIPVADGSFDSIVSTFTLCTIPDVGSALAEMRRSLAPGGRFVFLEHGLSPDTSVARWQSRLNGLQGVLFGGCHLTRRISTLVEHAGFRIERLEHEYLEGAPKFAGYLSRGVAVR
jgi:ubiquinone/menaquinone biosynthesis C-methylase UbiE